MSELLKDILYFLRIKKRRAVDFKLSASTDGGQTWQELKCRNQ